MEDSPSPRWPRLVAVVVALGIVVALVYLSPWIGKGDGLANGPAIDQAKATSLALAFYDSSHGSGATLDKVQVRSVDLGTDEHGRSVWKVNIVGEVTEAGSSFAYASGMALYVDAETGVITVFAQG